jgi:hypothetical protein
MENLKIAKVLNIGNLDMFESNKKNFIVSFSNAFKLFLFIAKMQTINKNDHL